MEGSSNFKFQEILCVKEVIFFYDYYCSSFMATTLDWMSLK